MTDSFPKFLYRFINKTNCIEHTRTINSMKIKQFITDKNSTIVSFFFKKYYKHKETYVSLFSQTNLDNENLEIQLRLEHIVKEAINRNYDLGDNSGIVEIFVQNLLSLNDFGKQIISITVDKHPHYKMVQLAFDKTSKQQILSRIYESMSVNHPCSNYKIKEIESSL